jgi:hypothetical protein
MAFSLAGCGGSGSSSGAVEITFDGEKYLFKKAEFRIYVNPVLGQTVVRTVEPGKVQAVRYNLHTENFSELHDGKAFVIGWWVDTDNPMETLKGYVGKEITNDETRPDDIYVNFLVDGKSIEVDNKYKSWIIIENVGEETVSGKFGGKFKVQDGKTFRTIGATTIEECSFEVPLRKDFKEK